jgi:hypothetical protein
VPSPASPASLLIDLARGLSPLSVSWYVFGAQAALIWGRPRLTTDVDVTVRLEHIDRATLVSALGNVGFTLRIVASPDFVRQTRVLPLVHQPSGLALDVVLAGPGLEDTFISRAIAVDIGGTPVPVISPEDLIVTKVLAGRSKDVDDIRGVIAERGPSLDVEQIRATIRMLEDALGQSDLLPLFEAEWERAGPHRR